MSNLFFFVCTIYSRCFSSGEGEERCKSNKTHRALHFMFWHVSIWNFLLLLSCINCIFLKWIEHFFLRFTSRLLAERKTFHRDGARECDLFMSAREENFHGKNFSILFMKFIAMKLTTINFMQFCMQIFAYESFSSSLFAPEENHKALTWNLIEICHKNDIAAAWRLHIVSSLCS